MKETLTLLERCQREASEKVFNINNYNGISMGTIVLKDLDEAIANTLKQAAEALEGLQRNEAKCVCVYAEGCGCKVFDYNSALTDAQKVLLGEDND